MATATASLRKDANNSTGASGIWNKTYITTQTTTLIKSGAGILHTITFNKPVSTGTCELDDAITQTNPFGIITSAATSVPVTLIYDVEFTAGLSITTAVAAQDITVAWA